jgi:hypothetical protein
MPTFNLETDYCVWRGEPEADRRVVLRSHERRSPVSPPRPRAESPQHNEANSEQEAPHGPYNGQEHLRQLGRVFVPCEQTGRHGGAYSDDEHRREEAVQHEGSRCSGRLPQQAPLVEVAVELHVSEHEVQTWVDG